MNFIVVLFIFKPKQFAGQAPKHFIIPSQYWGWNFWWFYFKGDHLYCHWASHAAVRKDQGIRIRRYTKVCEALCWIACTMLYCYYLKSRALDYCSNTAFFHIFFSMWFLAHWPCPHRVLIVMISSIPLQDFWFYFLFCHLWIHCPFIQRNLFIFLFNKPHRFCFWPC